jgi:hypothetical protein
MLHSKTGLKKRHPRRARKRMAILLKRANHALVALKSAPPEIVERVTKQLLQAEHELHGIVRKDNPKDRARQKTRRVGEKHTRHRLTMQAKRRAARGSARRLFPGDEGYDPSLDS